MDSTHEHFEALRPVEAPQKVRSEAKQMEALAALSVEAFSWQLHQIPNDQRLALIKQIQKDQTTNHDPNLPNLQFNDDGQLTSADLVHKEPGSVEHIEFDPNTGRKTSDDFTTPNTTSHK